MKRADIISKIVEATDLTQAKAEDAMKAFLEAVKEALRSGEKVTLRTR